MKFLYHLQLITSFALLLVTILGQESGDFEVIHIFDNKIKSLKSNEMGKY